MKRTEIYTQSQIQNLCEELKVVSADAYADKNRKLVPNTNPATYTILADEINEYENNIAREGMVCVSTTWLRQLFTEYTKQPSSTINALMLDSVCMYVSNLFSKEYFNSLSSNISNFFGTYDFYWKGTTTLSKHTKTVVDFKLKITPVEVLLINIDTNQTYIGETPSILIGNAYIEVLDRDRHEKVYLVLHIGISISNLDYISGLYLSVDSGPHPTSGPIMLVRENQEKIRNDVIEEYFNRYDSKALIKAYTIDRVRKMLADLKIRSNNERLKGLFGNWLLVLRHSDTNKLDVGKLIIRGINDLHYDSCNNEYKEGEIRILIDQNLRIQLKRNSRYACLLANIGASNKLQNVEFIVSTYTSTGSFAPNCGIAILQRYTEGFKDIGVGYYEESHAIFDQLRDNKYLDLIMSYEQVSLDGVNRRKPFR